MRPDELRNAMKTLSLTTADVGLIAGCTDRQVRHWLCGVHEIPRAAAILLIGLKEGMVDRDWVADVVMSELRGEIEALEGTS